MSHISRQIIAVFGHVSRWDVLRVSFGHQPPPLSLGPNYPAGDCQEVVGEHTCFMYAASANPVGVTNMNLMRRMDEEGPNMQWND